MATAKTYTSGQLIYDGTTIESNSSYMTKLGTVSPAEVLRPQNAGDNKNLNYQQIILQAKENGAVQNFNPESSYYVKLTLPRDKSFNFDYGLRLLNYNEQNGRANLDTISNYELIKYITVFPVNSNNMGYNNVGLYQEKIGENWKVVNNGVSDVPDTHTGIIIDINNVIDEQPDINGYDPDYLSDKILRHDITPNGQTKKIYEYFVRKNNMWKKLGQEGDYWINVMPLNHGQTETSEESSVFEFIFTPMYYNTYNTIYLNLIPDTIDGDIQWRKKINSDNDNTEYYGRYIEGDITEVIQCEIYQINNWVTPNQSPWINVGVWGRSELMLTINGVEIKIGPSGYYELRDYNITSFGIAAKDYKDKFTVDYQY